MIQAYGNPIIKLHFTLSQRNNTYFQSKELSDFASHLTWYRDKIRWVSPPVAEEGSGTVPGVEVEVCRYLLRRLRKVLGLYLV